MNINNYLHHTYSQSIRLLKVFPVKWEIGYEQSTSSIFLNCTHKVLSNLVLIPKHDANLKELLIHFGEDKTKSILSLKAEKLREINISFADHSIKQLETVEHLGCQLDSKLSGETMVSKVLKKINVELKFLHRQSRYLTLEYKRLLCNVLIQPHFDYGCSSWSSLWKESLKFKLQKAQNTYIRFCLTLPPHTSEK